MHQSSCRSCAAGEYDERVAKMEGAGRLIWVDLVGMNSKELHMTGFYQQYYTYHTTRAGVRLTCDPGHPSSGRRSRELRVAVDQT